MFPASEATFFARKILDYGVIGAIKQQRQLTNLTNMTMVCSYHSSCLDLPMALVDCPV